MVNQLKENKGAKKYSHLLSKGLVITLLLLFWGRLLHTMLSTSATFDEPLHLLQGVMYWQIWSLYSVVQNPPLINAWLGSVVQLIFTPSLPSIAPDQPLQDWLKVSHHFLWELNNGLVLVFIGRVANSFLSLFLACLVYGWSKQLSHSHAAGLLALCLYTFDPNILAHSALATTDLGTAFFILLSAYACVRQWQNPSRRGFWAAGIALGLALSAKFSGVLLFPAVALAAAWVTWQESQKPVPFRQSRWVHLQGLAIGLAVWFLVAVLVVALIYRLDWVAFQTDFILQQTHQSEGHSSYLLGERSLTGWWYYFPVLLLTKTPVATLALLFVGILYSVTRYFLLPTPNSPLPTPHFLLLIVALFFTAGLLSSVNIGYRYLLPMWPLLFVVMSQLALTQTRWGHIGLGLAAGYLMVSSLWIHPHYLAYFNEPAGGPDNGWRIAVDSNIDWGQDLPALAQLVQEKGIEKLYISYLGTADFATYGIPAAPLPGWPTARPNPATDTFYPPRPAAGWYALSATQLLGVYLDDPGRFAYFQNQTPVAKAGYSIFLYRVEPSAPPAELALSGIGLSQLNNEDVQQTLQSSEVNLRWFSAWSSFLHPAGSSRWLAVGTGHLPSHPALQALYPRPVLAGLSPQVGENGEPLQYQFFELTEELNLEGFSQEWTEPITPLFGEQLTLLGYQLLPPEPHQQQLLTAWQVNQTPSQELKIFVHLLDAAGQVAAQHDGLDVQTQSLRPGDMVVQLHTLNWNELPAGAYTLQLGVYETAAGQRLLLPTQNDRLVLKTITKPE
jgi:hypothetical protein